VNDKKTVRLTIDIEFKTDRHFTIEEAESSVFEMFDEMMEETSDIGGYKIKEYETTAQRLDAAKEEARGRFVDGPVTIRTLLDVSTAHMNEEEGFGHHRVVDHEFGKLVFLGIDFSADPDWLKPIVVEARKVRAMVINFDRDAKMVEGWTDYSEEVA
jgi:hypothetical protein